MSHFDAYNLLKWMHFIALSMIGGGAVVALLISGFEDEREDLRGLAATIWKQVVCWGFRLSLLLGVVLLVLKYLKGVNPFLEYYLHLKLTLVVIIFPLVEMAPKALAVGKRGAALLSLLVFLLISFAVYNKSAFGSRHRPAEVPPTAATVLSAR